MTAALFSPWAEGHRSECCTALACLPQSSFKKIYTGKQCKCPKSETGRIPLTIKLCTSLLSNSYRSKSNTLNSSLAWSWYNHTPLFLSPSFSVIRLKNNYYPHYTNFQVMKMYLTHYFRNCCPLPHWILSVSTISIMSDRPPFSLSPPY